MRQSKPISRALFSSVSNLEVLVFRIRSFLNATGMKCGDK